MSGRLTILLALLLACFAPAASAAAKPLVGWNDNAVHEATLTPERDADLQRKGGATTVRILVDWGEIEATRGKLDWGWYDRILNAYRGQGLQPILMLQGAPSWATTQGRGGVSGAELNAWGSFVGELAQRYSDVAAIE